MAKILFVASHDWLFVRRHLPAVRAARELGLEVVVAARASGLSRTILATGARCIDLGAEVQGFSPVGLWRFVMRLNAVLASESPVIVQFHGVRPIIAGAIAARIQGSGKRAFVFDGLGLIGRRQDALGQIGVALARNLIGPLTGAASQLVFDNPDDPVLLGLDAAAAPSAMRSKFRIFPGAGVDPLIHSPETMPWSPPLKLAFGSPLLWANGPDLAVDAVNRARNAGADVTLSLIGRACKPGRAAVSEATLSGWSRMPGVSWFAPTADVAQVWRQHHVLILPSRGGDGLPLLMTEAASASRAILTTDVGGCRSFVRDGIDGLVVPSGNPEALSNAIIQLARAPALVERMGRSARERVLEGYTERHVMEAYKQLWWQMLQQEVTT